MVVVQKSNQDSMSVSQKSLPEVTLGSYVFLETAPLEPEIYSDTEQVLGQKA